MKKVELDFHGRTLTVETGKMAKQANGSVFIRLGDTAVLVTACTASSDRDVDFLPLSCDYFERTASAGKIPGGFFKREGRQSEKEILTSRLMDRPIRPLFPKTYRRETQIISTVMSYDKENEADVLSMLGASIAIHISDLPMERPVAAVRVGLIDGKWSCNPTRSEIEQAEGELVVACSSEAILMVEGAAKQVPEAQILEGLRFAFDSCQPLIEMQENLRKEVGKPKIEVAEESPEEKALEEKVEKALGDRMNDILALKEKLPRYRALGELKSKVAEEMIAEDASVEDQKGKIGGIIHHIYAAKIREAVVNDDHRLEGRKSDEVRAITSEVGILPRTHGSALFTRGETQAIVTATLGTTDDEQIIDALAGETRRNFLLHYNFPPFCVGEVKPMRGPARREIGHGALAYKAISPILPTGEEFPYTLRVVSDVLESHGSSSMATVCGAALSLMDAGVPIKAPVAGIAMGLVKEGEKFLVLSDISGDEDHIGDMDFKVAGTREGVTAVQMDIKIKGIGWDIMEKALSQAKEGRVFILDKMQEAIDNSRTELSPHAPRIETIQVKQDKIREIIGPGGKMIRSIVEESGAKVDINDDGIVTIASENADSLRKARDLVEGIVAEAEVGKIYKGKVARLMEYGAFVQILPNQDGLLHVSEMYAEERIDNVSDFLEEGDEVEVMVLDVDRQGKIKLSQREIVEPGSAAERQRKAREERGDRGDRGRNGRGGGRGRGQRNGGGRRESRR